MKKPITFHSARQVQKSILRKVLLGLLVIFILMQFYRIDKTNPPMDPAQDFLTAVNAPIEMATMVKNACYDCHSHATKYPWYTEIMPFAKMIQGHIENGRKELNFSTWTTYEPDKRDHKLEEAGEMVIETKMPLTSYLIAHPEARISKEERQTLANWFESLITK
jgi:Haem-binding domain